VIADPIATIAMSRQSWFRMGASFEWGEHWSREAYLYHRTITWEDGKLASRS
jgi:hypothetical protein